MQSHQLKIASLPKSLVVKYLSTSIVGRNFQIVAVVDWDSDSIPSREHIKEKRPSRYLERHSLFLVGAEGVEPPTLCL